MARSISEIKRTMTDAFMQDEAIRDAYGLSSAKHVLQIVFQLLV